MYETSQINTKSAQRYMNVTRSELIFLFSISLLYMHIVYNNQAQDKSQVLSKLVRSNHDHGPVLCYCLEEIDIDFYHYQQISTFICVSMHFDSLVCEVKMFVLCYVRPSKKTNKVSRDKSIKTVLRHQDDEESPGKPDTECVGVRKTLHSNFIS